LYPQDFCGTGDAAKLPDASSGGDRSFLYSEVVVQGTDATRIQLNVRFLSLIDARGDGDATAVGPRAVERDVIVADTSLGDLIHAPNAHAFGDAHVRAAAQVSGSEVRDGLYKIAARIANVGPPASLSESRDRALLRSLVSTHLVFTATDGDFVSLLDPTDVCRDVVATCRNVGVWPVLVGEPGTHDCLLASPIVLYDYPQIAPESAGDLFDATEIDEILALRILTLTEDEKREARQSDRRAREILDRTEQLPPEHWARLHGAVRGLRRVTEHGQ
jgi:hypothetical protein